MSVFQEKMNSVTRASNMSEETQINPQKRIIGKPFKVGNPGGSGAPKLSEQEKIKRRAMKEMVKVYVKEYEEGLAEALPEIQPALIDQAKKGNVKAIREIHEVVGAHKNKGGNVVVPVQININEDREKYA